MEVFKIVIKVKETLNKSVVGGTIVAAA